MDLAHPTNCLTFHLSRAARSLQRGFEEAARDAGLTAPQFSTLTALDALADAPLGALADRLGTDRTTLTRNLALLAREGLAAPSGATDRRVRAWALTEAGRARLALARPAWDRWQASQVALLGEDGARALLATLQRL